MDRKIEILCGPCSAESREQILRTARELSENSIEPDFFRAGVWKPRSRPGTFTGAGEDAFEWLTEVKKQYGYKIMVEVASPAHIEIVSRYDVEAVWIGARTAVNPFQVQELASELNDTGMTVFLKNPIIPDYDLWAGGLERLLEARVKDVRTIHRGFSAGYRDKFRNTPLWQMPIQIMSQFPDVKIYCDASHIAGRPELLQEISQKALDLNYYGLMIETHHDPKNALSDARQQVTPATLAKILHNLHVRDIIDSEQLPREIIQIREEIDVIDDDIVDFLIRRMMLSRVIGRRKKKYNISILQPERWKEILHRSQQKIENTSLSPLFIQKIYEAIHDESIDQQLLEEE